MQVFLVIALIIATLAVVFAVQNTMAVTVSFLFWTYNSSLAIVLLVALCAGALISLLFSLPSLVRDKWAIRTHRKKMTELETNLADHKSKLEAAQKQTTDLETSLADHKSKLEEAQKKLQEKEAPGTDVPPQEAAGGQLS